MFDPISPAARHDAASTEPAPPINRSLLLDALTALLCAPLAILLVVGTALDLLDHTEDALVSVRRWATETIDLLGCVGDAEDG